ncbi:hypothetical protein SF23_00165 [Streptomyces sp. MBRL 10]|nr:hypothetical protein SF23_00165 [Streptomyces sp. MBRL 10]
MDEVVSCVVKEARLMEEVLGLGGGVASGLPAEVERLGRYVEVEGAIGAQERERREPAVEPVMDSVSKQDVQGVRVGEQGVHGAVEDDDLPAARGGLGHSGRLDLHEPLEGGQLGGRGVGSGRRDVGAVGDVLDVAVGDERARAEGGVAEVAYRRGLAGVGGPLQGDDQHVVSSVR